ncbi:MAG: hypothetical protein FWF00_03550 [Endomicrobia bacterium]|nr:hypothetical protein [Endomicrobiia bacterium]MCL2506750.1 hypothetical protein [Endomicrobiia bacterium]
MKNLLKLFTVFVFCFAIITPYAYGEPIPVDSLFKGLESGIIILEFDDPVTVTGYVIDTGISKYLTPYVALSDKKGGEQYAVCVLPRADSLKLKDFAKDEKVTMEGHFYAFRDKVVIKKCSKVTE